MRALVVVLVLATMLGCEPSDRELKCCRSVCARKELGRLELAQYAAGSLDCHCERGAFVLPRERARLALCEATQ